MTAQTATTWTRCRLCKARLKAEAGDDVGRGVCHDCSGRPEAQRLAVGTNGHGATAPDAPAGAPPRPRPFTDADRSLIRAMHGYLPIAELLRLLNERMVADVGAATVPYTHEDLHREVATLGVARQDDWTELRQLLAQARVIGLLDRLTPDVLQSFSVVFQLSSGQLSHLRDIIAHAQEAR